MFRHHCADKVCLCVGGKGCVCVCVCVPEWGAGRGSRFCGSVTIGACIGIASARGCMVMQCPSPAHFWHHWLLCSTCPLLSHLRPAGDFRDRCRCHRHLLSSCNWCRGPLLTFSSTALLDLSLPGPWSEQSLSWACSLAVAGLSIAAFI